MCTYLTTEELSARIKYDPRTIRERLKDSVERLKDSVERLKDSVERSRYAEESSAALTCTLTRNILHVQPPHG